MMTGLGGVMDKKATRTFITRLTIGWFALGFVLLGVLLAGLIEKDLFLNIFAGGFILWVLVVTFLSRTLYDGTDSGE